MYSHLAVLNPLYGGVGPYGGGVGFQPEYSKGTLTIVTEQAGDFIRASFTDDGPGIPREDITRIFNPFFTTKEVGKGTGLGLSICHGIVTGHGGRIWAESKPGKGSTFTVELPIYKRLVTKSE